MDATTLDAYRANKDDYLRSNARSPLPYEFRSAFSGLPYYEWNPDLIFKTTLTDADGAETAVATSDGDRRTYRRSATVSLEIAGETLTLALYDTGHPGLFLPFRDATSGRETYGGGRYLDIQPDDEGGVVIDFNLAYSPYCAYDDGYSCALPPAENWLSVPITAGEKVWRRPA
ncbi:MAG: DUF1684 domain-containing protein [Acidimicrobiia bacterium]|nr:DUF1684 domain-containing protein [Acidimicrobiia bacterium]